MGRAPALRVTSLAEPTERSRVAIGWVTRRPDRAGLDRSTAVAERALVSVQLVDDHLVEAEIGGGGELAGGIDIDRMRMRLLLPAGIDARPLVLNGAGRLAELAVGVDRQTGDAAAAVVGDKGVLARLVE